MKKMIDLKKNKYIKKKTQMKKKKKINNAEMIRQLIGISKCLNYLLFFYHEKKRDISTAFTSWKAISVAVKLYSKVEHRDEDYPSKK